MQLFSASDRIPSLPVGGGIRAPLFERKRVDASRSRTDHDGRFQGYASVFGAMDLGRDVVMPGAFRDSITHRGPRGVKLLWQHDPGQPVGIFTQMSEDRYGLFVEGLLDLKNPKAQQLHRMIERGTLDGLSIGFRTQIERRESATGLRRLDKIDLWEISLVTFPLLPQARLTELKTITGTA